jgi:hypothetical protein
MAGFRTRISCKAEAFAAPWGFLEGGTYWDDWSNALSSRELALAEAYEQLGRPDRRNIIDSTTFSPIPSRSVESFSRLSELSGMRCDM